MTDLALPDFVDHLQDASDAFELGFHFEEGGCYGMALALHGRLTEMGLRPRFGIVDDLAHCAVVVNDAWIDYCGREFQTWGERSIMPIDTTAEQFMEIVLAGNARDEDDMEADRDLAFGVIDLAIDRAANPEAAPGL